MTVFHGSDREIRKPDIFHSRKEVDFGPGFYVTPLREQARNWCKKFIRQGKPGVVSEYTTDEKVFEKYRVLRFTKYSDQWLDFVAGCRKGLDESDYEIVIGGVANDRVFDTIELYFQNLITRAEALGRLKYEKPNLQICFRCQEALNQYIRFERSFTL